LTVETNPTEEGTYRIACDKIYFISKEMVEVFARKIPLIGTYFKLKNTFVRNLQWTPRLIVAAAT